MVQFPIKALANPAAVVYSFASLAFLHFDEAVIRSGRITRIQLAAYVAGFAPLQSQRAPSDRLMETQTTGLDTG